jgi:threonyl-tRNA synthetase
MYTTFEMSLRARLSYRDDSDKYFGEPKLWEEAQATIRELAQTNELDFFEAEGEAAFYGPKIDFMATDAIGREHQVATVQFDFVQPERFELAYTTEGGAVEQPIMIHCALLGSVERFLSVYIEHTAGKFPVWVAPEQLRIITVNQELETVEFAALVENQAKELGIRMYVDNSNESVGKKIRSAEIMKIPYTIVLGDKETESKEVTPRIRKDMVVQEPKAPYSLESFLGTIAHEAKSRTTKSSL